MVLENGRVGERKIVPGKNWTGTVDVLIYDPNALRKMEEC